MIKVKTFIIGNTLKNLNHIIYCNIEKKAIICDPYAGDLILDFLEKNSLKALYIVNTHHHADHIKDNEYLSSKLNIPVLKNKNNQQIEITKTSYIRSIHTPGHVSDHFIFEIVDNDNVCGYITGDTLFNSGVGNCKNGGNLDELYETIKKTLYSLNKNAIIYPSHDYFLSNLEFAKTLEPENEEIDNFIDKKKESLERGELLFTRISDELKYNPFLRLGQLQKKDKTLSEKEVFIKIRSLRDRW